MKAQEPLGVAIVGCGLIGNKRAGALRPGQLRFACDTNLKQAESLAGKFPGCAAVSDLDAMLQADSVSLVIVAAPNAALAPVALRCLESGKHVLVEKPGGLHSSELRQVLEAADARRLRVTVGYNHRFHPALQKARALVDSGQLGPLMFLRGRYGHGGRIGYEQEWRADPLLSGGGELIDQGVHLIDLAGWFLGDFSSIDGHACTSFWKMAVDDNAFLSLRTPEGQTAWLHVSCSEWKNLFSLEIYGRDGKLSVEGLGGSYGLEKLTWHRMLPEMGPPETTCWEYPRGDQSWTAELEAFEKDIRNPISGNRAFEQNVRTLEIVETIYTKSGFTWARPPCPA